MRLIDAEAVKQFIYENGYVYANTLDKFPTIDLVKHGRWIMRGGYFRCSECDAKSLLRNAGGTGGYREYDQVQSKFCPNCGARMDGGEEK